MKNANFTRLNRRFFLIAAGSLTTSLIFSSCGRSESETATSNTSSNPSSPSPQSEANLTLKVGATPIPHAEILRFVQDNLAQAAGLTIDVVEFSDYVQPNLALKDEQLDANYFQHVPYMEDFGKERAIDMVAVASVHIEPLGLYSKRIKALSELSNEATVAIPNDATNLGRSLKLLADNQILTLKPEAGVAATKQDITQNPKNLRFAELEAAQLPRSLEDVDLAVINGNYAIEVGLKPSLDALALEAAQNNPYANVLAVLRGRETDPSIQKLGELLTSAEVKQFIEEKYQGAVIAAF